MNDWHSVSEPPAAPPAMPEEVCRRMADDRWRFRDYVLVRQVGEGPIARVFRAWDTAASRYVALKLLHSDRTTPAMVDRFFTETRAASRLHHPNVVRIHRVGRHAGVTFGELELVDADSLQIRLQRGEVFAPRTAARIVDHAARAIAAAHHAGLVHGDLKPSNVFVVGEAAKVSDFGMWRVRGDASEARDPAADVRSLGTLLERMLRGEASDLRPLIRASLEGGLSTEGFLEGLERWLAGFAPAS